MDDSTGKKKSFDLVRILLLGNRRGRPAISLLFLTGILLLSLVSGASVDTTHLKYTCNADTSSNGKIKCAEWYANGDLHIVKKFRNGKRHGIWSHYLPGGALEKRVKYKKGKLLYELYFEDDKVYKTIDKNGKVRFKKKCDCL